MRWHSLRDRFADCPTPPFLLERAAGDRTEGLTALGFELADATVGAGGTEREIARTIGTSIGLGDNFRGGWDAFLDLLLEGVVEPGRVVAVRVAGADALVRHDVRLFTRLVWMLMKATETVESAGRGEAQLEFLFVGDWPPAG